MNVGAIEDQFRRPAFSEGEKIHWNGETEEFLAVRLFKVAVDSLIGDNRNLSVAFDGLNGWPVQCLRRCCGDGDQRRE